MLIGAVTSKRHEEMLDRWLDTVDKFTYPHHLFLVETTVGTDSYLNKLKKRGLDVVKYKWDTKNKHCFQMMADAKNLLRDRFLENGYDLFFSFDTDEFLPPEALARLINHDKDNVGYPTPMWHKEPCVFKEGGYVAVGDGTFTLAKYSWEDLFARCEQEKTQLLKVHSVGNGCLLSKKKVFEQVRWGVPHFPVIAEDTLFYTLLEKKGFESYVDMGIIPEHYPVGWNKVPTWTEKMIFGRKMQIAHGWVTDDEPGTRKIEYYGPAEKPGDGTERPTEVQGSGDKPGSAKDKKNLFGAV